MFDIGNRIREIRKQKNITTKELADRLSVAQSFVSSLENNTKKCSTENLFKICEVFGITVQQFFDDGSKPSILSPELQELLDNANGLPIDVIRSFSTTLKSVKNNYKIIHRNINNRDTEYLVNLNTSPEGIPEDKELEINRLIDKAKLKLGKKESDK